MEAFTGAASESRSVVVLRPPMYGLRSSPYENILGNLDFDLIRQPTHTAMSAAIENGCRVGLLILAAEEDLRNLDLCEPFLNIGKIAWIGLIARELIARPPVLQLIGEHLFNFIQIPANADHIDLMIRHAWGMAYARERHGHSKSASRHDVNREMVGKSPQIQRLFDQIRKVARTDASVLICGPSGTGKEMVARAVHRQSARDRAPFIAVNCGAIAPNLFQSELFGHEKGAFTGASQRKIGRIEAAKGGTLFLDEIGDMPMEMQVNLLRFLQERTFERVGSTTSVHVDVRVIAATHVDLAAAVREGRFREDLYYRINVVSIRTPTLAERIQDVEELALYYFARFAGQHNKSLRGFSKAAMKAMLHHTWPGNVRELVNRVQSATVMAEGRFIQPEDLGFESSAVGARIISLDDARASAERLMIERALLQSQSRVSHAAALLGISRVKLYRLMEKYGIGPNFRPLVPHELTQPERKAEHR